MRLISSRTHGLLDYLVALVLMALPFLFGFSDDFSATAIPISLGLFTILYSAFTRYEFGLFHVIPFRAHLSLDVANAVVLGTSPFVLHFAGRVYGPHVAVALLEACVILLSPWQAAEKNASADTAGNIPRRSPEALRVAIDRGMTGEKVNFPDPAAAPLGTDDEAAGTSFLRQGRAER